MVLLLALLSMVIEPSGLMTVLSVSLSSEIVYVSLLLWDMVVKEEKRFCLVPPETVYFCPLLLP